MGRIEQLKQRVVNLVAAPGEELSGWARLVQVQIRVWWLCARRLRDHNALAMSAALSFRTIFALVPTIVLAFLMLKGLGFIDQRKALLDDVMYEMGLDRISYAPQERTRATAAALDTAAAQTVMAHMASPQMIATHAAAVEVASDRKLTGRVTVGDEIRRLIERVESKLTLGALGPVGVALLVWTALTLLTTVERSLNRIFEAPRARPLALRILLYWSVLTLAPLMLLLVQFVFGKAQGALASHPAVSWLVGSAGWIVALVVGIVVLAFIYQLMPNTRVALRAAAAGAAAAVPLWLLARWGVSVYVRRVAASSLYGAMGLIPLFLIWMNTSWWIFLFGAQLAYSAANVHRLSLRTGADAGMLGPWDLLAAMVATARVNAADRRPVATEKVAVALALADDQTAMLLERLEMAGLLGRVPDERDGRFLPAIPVDQIRVVDVLRIDSPYGGPAARAVARPIRTAIGRVLSRSEAGIEHVTVADIIGEAER